MEYVLLSLIPKKGTFSMLEFERMKQRINKLLINEFVDHDTVFWDETGDLIFTPPVNKKDKSYWISSLNSHLNRNEWEFVSGRI